MRMDRILTEFRSRFPTRGEFLLAHHESINDVVTRENIPTGYGVYVISGCRGAHRAILYIGKAGTVLQGGTFKKQGLRKRLTMKQDRMRRKDFFRNVMLTRDLEALHFEWFVTYDDKQRVPPFLAEAQLLAAFLEDHGQLPDLNKEA